MPDPLHAHDIAQCHDGFHPANGIPIDYALRDFPCRIGDFSGMCSLFCMLHLQADSYASR